MKQGGGEKKQEKGSIVGENCRFIGDWLYAHACIYKEEREENRVCLFELDIFNGCDVWKRKGKMKLEKKIVLNVFLQDIWLIKTQQIHSHFLTFLSNLRTHWQIRLRWKLTHTRMLERARALSADINTLKLCWERVSLVSMASTTL